MTAPKVKGSAFIPGRKYLLKHYGKKSLEKVLALMDPEDRVLVKETPLASKWYPYKTFVALLRATDDVLGKGDRTFLVDMGCLAAKEGLSTFYKLFIRMGKPKATLERMEKVWKSYFDSGTMEVVKLEDGRVVVRQHDWPDPRKEFCMASAGFIKGAIELAGGTNTKIVETRCACMGDKFCEFEATWDEPG